MKSENGKYLSLRKFMMIEKQIPVTKQPTICASVRHVVYSHAVLSLGTYTNGSAYVNVLYVRRVNTAQKLYLNRLEEYFTFGNIYLIRCERES